jgi:hypothetical protein
MPKLSRSSPALIVATIALFVAAGGGAWAATRNTDSALYARATNPKASLASRGPRGPRGPRGFRGLRGLTGPRGNPGAPGPSDGFVINVPQEQPMSGGTDTRLAQLSLTVGGSYIVTAATELGGSAGGDNNFISCTLLQNSNPVGAGSAEPPALAAFADTLTLTAAVSTTNGANVSLSCNPSDLAIARNTVITAVRVGTLHTETP